ncbi:MAG TPA: 16S rRNA (cytosine(967)-C(5))-methyltransferase RsmB [Terriglobales bacterium]
MPISPARVAAFEILLRIDREDSYASELLHAARYARLSSVDHGLATELVMGVLRWRSILDSHIASASSQQLSRLDLEVLTALRIGCYQLMFLDRVPRHAAVNESVELVKRARKRSAAAFANAVLRKLAKVTIQPPDIGVAERPTELAAASAHPAWLVDRWISAYGFERTRELCEYDRQTPVTALRVPSSEIERELASEGITLEPGSLLATSRRVISGDVTKTKGFRAGQVTIQDEGSQLVGLLVGQGNRILDGCAAPGGKTRIMAQQNPGATVVAAELHPHRARLMRDLVREKNVCVIVSDIRKLPFVADFDRVLIDAPCSGTGTLAHNPEIKWRIEKEKQKDAHLSKLQTLQIDILKSAMRHVAPRGRIVYSTCSLEPEENEQVIDKAAEGESIFRVINCRDELQRLAAERLLIWPDLDSLISGPYLRTIPGVHPCDGFFAAILERTI